MNAVPAKEMSANGQRRSSAGSQTQWALQAGVKGYAVIQHPDADNGCHSIFDPLAYVELSYL